MPNIKDILLIACGIMPEMEKTAKVLMNKYEFGKLLGQGNFAKVYHARDLRTDDSVAIKVIDKKKVKKVRLEVQTKREISIMRLVKHPNILRIEEVLATKTKIYFILEYAKGGELFNKKVKDKLPEDKAREYFQQLINAVEFCHQRGVYHRDLKPENLLLDEDGVLKVADFGLGALTESQRRDGKLHTVCGTPAYVAPEILAKKGYDGAKSDVWSCGVILYVLLAGYLPFNDYNLMALYRKIRLGEYKCPNWFSVEVRILLAKILDPDPQTRISIEKIKENPWFRKGLNSKPVQVKKEVMDEAAVIDSDKVTDFSENECASVVEEHKELVQPTYLNAFHILSLSAGLDLSVLFASNKEEKQEIRFTSLSSASTILSRIEGIAEILKMKISKKNGGFLKLERSREYRRGPLVISAEIFEFASSFYLVEIKMTCGDPLEYQKILNLCIRQALKEIVWIWQGEQHNNNSKMVSRSEKIH